MVDAPEIANPINPTPVVSIPAKEPVETNAPIVTTQAPKADATDAEIIAESPHAQNPAFPLARPGSTGAGAPTQPAILSGPIVKAPGASATPQGVPPALVSGKARKPVDPSTAKSKALSVSSKPENPGDPATGGVSFIKNNFNENVVLPNGRIYKFKKSKETVYDPAVIAGLRQVAGKYAIFEVPAETVAETAASN